MLQETGLDAAPRAKGIQLSEGSGTHGFYLEKTQHASKLSDIQGAAAELGDVGSMSKPPPALHTSGVVIRLPGSLAVRNVARNPTLPLHPSPAADWL